MSNRRAVITLGGALLAVFVVCVAIAGGSRPATAVAYLRPNSNPIVCSGSGACFEVDNTGHGIAVLGQAVGKNAVGVRGIAPGMSFSGTGISGQVFGPTSIAVNGRSFSTDPTNPSEGVVGLSANGAGVIGTTTFNSPLAITGAAGIFGQDKSKQFGFDMGVEGTSSKGVGVAGISKNANGVTGSSANANGVVGQTTFFATSGPGQAGVLGQDLATPNPLGNPTVNLGVSGTSSYGTGVFGLSSNGTGIIAFSNSGTALVAQSLNGPGLAVQAHGSTAATISNSNGTGLNVSAVSGEGLVVSAQSSDVARIESASSNTGLLIEGGSDIGINVSAKQGIVAQGTGGPAINAIQDNTSFPALQISTDSENNAPLILATVNSDVMSLDQSGNMILAGSLTENGTPLVAHRQSNGWGVGTYSAQQTTRTVEDLGEAQLQGGQAYVHLDPAFASVTDTRQTYLVFLTPQGNCRGLYVAQKTQAGFAVQEMGQGQSSIAFDYRIVAPSRDSSGARLPRIAPIRSHRVGLPQRLVNHSIVGKPVGRTMPTVRAGYVPFNTH